MRNQLDTKVRNMYWLIGRRSKMSIEFKATIYKVILMPIRTYGIQLWGTASNSNIDILERFQTKTLRKLLNILWYISNRFLYHELHVPTVRDEIQTYSKRYQERLAKHPNALASDLITQGQKHFCIKRPNILDLHERFL